MGACGASCSRRRAADHLDELGLSAAWVPWEKLRRATSSPWRTSLRKISGVLQEGPRVATILARRLYLSAAKPRALSGRALAAPEFFVSINSYSFLVLGLGKIVDWRRTAGRMRRVVRASLAILTACRGSCVVMGDTANGMCGAYDAACEVFEALPMCS